MFGIGFGELMIIAVIILIAVGPKRLPAMMRTVGKGVREVRKASEELRRSIGVDELIRDEQLRNPLRADPIPPTSTYRLTPADLERESPPEGVDVAYAEHRAQQPASAGATTGSEPAEPS